MQGGDAAVGGDAAPPGQSDAAPPATDAGVDAAPVPPEDMGFVQRVGSEIVDGRGHRLLLRGFGLGGWLVPEGYMWGANAPVDSPTRIRAAIVDLVGEDVADEFFARYEQSYVAEADIAAIAALGVNSIRLPLTWKKLIALDGTFIEAGFEQIDALIEWSSANGMYVILDLHCAPGGQSADNIADADGVARLWTEPDTYWPLTVALWRRLAERYADEPWVAAYDLINEPVLPSGHGNDELRALLIEITDAVREVDTNHLLFVEGNWYATDFTSLDNPWDEQLAYSFHLYNWSGATPEPGWINGYLALREGTGRPLWVGETGENTEAWISEVLRIFEERDIGWSVWTHKKLETGSSPWSAPRRPGFAALIAYWNGDGARPAADVATEALYDEAEYLALEHCTRRDGWVRAVCDQIPTQTEWTVPGRVEAEGYDDMSGIWVGEYEEVRRVGYFDTGDWVEYVIEVAADGDFTMVLSQASTNAAGRIEVTVDGGPPIEVGVANTGAWTTYQTVSVGVIHLDAGSHALRIAAVGGGGGVCDLDFFELTPS